MAVDEHLGLDDEAKQLRHGDAAEDHTSNTQAEGLGIHRDTFSCRVPLVYSIRLA
jgi:hypothetical protein